jgi:hypothetical protein
MSAATVTVRAFHNVRTDEAGRLVGMLDGYTEGDPVVLVFTAELPAGPSREALAEAVYRLLNVGDDPEFGQPDPRAVEYRKRRNRSLSVGDLVQVGPDYLAVDSFGFRLLGGIDPNIVNSPRHGTTPLAD